MLLLQIPALASPSSPLRSRPLSAHRRSRPSRLLHQRGPFTVVVGSAGDSGGDGGGGPGGDWWKITGLDRDAVREGFRSWLLKARTVLTEVATPIVKRGLGADPASVGEPEDVAVDEELLVPPEMTVERRTPSGFLSLAAAVSIEQFGRMNGLTGWKMQKIFESLAPEAIRNDVRSLVEYCCFRYLSRDSSDFHPNLKEAIFQRLIFVTMLAWEQPCTRDNYSFSFQENTFFQGRVVGEEAFVRIAPAVAGVADVSTAHHLFKALIGDKQGLSLSLWIAYLAELLKVHEGRQSYGNKNNIFPYEELVCKGSSRKQPVLKWEDNIAWPGNLILTDRALYFEAIGLTGIKKSMRLDLTSCGTRAEKTKVGPFAAKLFDSAISVSSGLNSETWTLEFVDFGSEMRRDFWLAFITEIISLYDFVREYGPSADDPSIHDVYGAHKGKQRAIRSAVNSIARLQSLQFIRKFSEDPAKLVQFSYLWNVPFGDVVFQTLAVSFWGGPLKTKFRQTNDQPVQWIRSVDDLSGSSAHVFDIDGSVYLRKWMKSTSWSSSLSITFWKNCLVKHGIVLAKNMVVAELSLVERAALTCKEKSQIMEKTRATIDAAMIEGIPSNIDLFKELILPLVAIGKNFDKLRHWEKPHLTVSFLIFVYFIIFRDLLRYVFPATLIVMATGMLLLKRLKEQGRLGRTFGRVVVRDQPPSNTIQKILALKEAMTYMENYLQNVNVVLLKIRAIMLSVQPEATSEVALVLLAAATFLIVMPFKYVSALLIFDLFTRELEFRRETVRKFRSFVRDRWGAIHAAPVVVLPYENPETVSSGGGTDTDPEISMSEKVLGSGRSPTKSKIRLE
ncbi:uncharacterized protein LOC122007330 [Zingiber officinale]|uniref:uncharacterized protein LOC122007330 n=1 Tax=Zingiber officinale TaxID=94328 RepID=UPI001C4D35C5|nr:uncharacterized protein LOC122007330 [Zingiber officinale]